MRKDSLFRSALVNYFGEFGKLLRLPREFWAIQALNMVYCLVYFSFVTVNSLHLSQDVGFSDQAAGVLIGVFMTGTAILQIFLGPVLDWIGFRKTPIIAAIVVAIGFLGIGASPVLFGATEIGRGFVIGFYLVAMVGNGLMFPILTAGTKRFSNKETQNPAFNFWYLTMQVGAIMLFMIDFVRRPLENNATLEQTAAFRNAGGNSELFWILAGLAALCGIIVFFFLKNEAQFPEFGEKIKPSIDTSALSKKPLGTMLKDVFFDKSFRKVLGILFITIPAHLPLVLVFVLYPKYWTRVLGADFEIGSLAAINPIVVIPCLIFLAPVVKKFNVYWVLLVGMIIGSLSMMVLAIPHQWVETIAGVDTKHAYLILIYAQIAVFAVGESIWSPQLQSYVASFTPEGSEGTFMGITRFPHITAKLLASSLSGFLLVRFCPENVMEKITNGTLSYFGGPEMMNLIMCMLALISPLIFLILHKYLYVAKQAE